MLIFLRRFNLFGGSVLKLGSASHEAALPGIDTFDDVGCFALTEQGYGNNAVCMGTTAIFDIANDCFVINSPDAKSQKVCCLCGHHSSWRLNFCACR
jgi:acyl-CoA oxidase